MQALELFLSSIRSSKTRNVYGIYFRKYQEFIGKSDIFFQNNPRAIGLKIIEFILDMKSKQKGYSTIHNYVAAILAFYKINDLILNVTKINKFIPIQMKVKKDRAYSREEIAKFLEISDERFRAVILLMASSGMRVGALPLLRVRHLENQKLIVYESDKEEYVSFVTPECKKAIDTYLGVRIRCGETLDKDSYLIREQFDIKDPFQVSSPRPLTIRMVNSKIIDLHKRIGMPKEVAITHGFRKFFTTQLVNSKLNPEIREMLLGHKIGLASAYYKPTEQEMLVEYMKAVNSLTINEENRLRMKVEKLEVEKTEFEALAADIARIKKKVKLR